MLAQRSSEREERQRSGKTYRSQAKREKSGLTQVELVNWIQVGEEMRA